MTKNKKEEDDNTCLSERTQKQIDELPKHAQEIYKEAHKSALERYQDQIKEGVLMKAQKLRTRWPGMQ